MVNVHHIQDWEPNPRNISDNDDSPPEDDRDVEWKTYPPVLFPVKVLEHETRALIASGTTASLCSKKLLNTVSSIVFRPQLRRTSGVILIDYFCKRKAFGEETLPIQIGGVEIDLYFSSCWTQ